MSSPLLELVGSREATVGVVGMGYVGLPLAIKSARNGYPTIGFDISERVVDGINAKRSHV